MGKNIVKEMSFDFALQVVKTYKELVRDKKEFVMSKQLLRSGTAVGALIREAEHAQSKADFIHKMSIALKEANETEYWIDLYPNQIGNRIIRQSYFHSERCKKYRYNWLLLSFLKKLWMKRTRVKFEFLFGLGILHKSDYLDKKTFEIIHKEATSILKLLISIVKTSRNSSN